MFLPPYFRLSLSLFFRHDYTTNTFHKKILQNFFKIFSSWVPVRQDLAKFRHFAKTLLVFGNFLTVHFLSGKMLGQLWRIYYIIGQIFSAPNGQILKNNLTIWSCCWFWHTRTRSTKGKIFMFYGLTTCGNTPSSCPLMVRVTEPVSYSTCVAILCHSFNFNLDVNVSRNTNVTNSMTRWLLIYWPNIWPL